ncbi:hypothetical protein ACFL2Q_15695 [Thermodesulfobacteriota bacterium]
MSSTHDEGTTLSHSINLEASPSEMLGRIGDFFSRLGIFGRTVPVEHNGNRYRVSCDEAGFVVYRINTRAVGRHHVPGWPVCMVTDDSVFQEPCSPDPGGDHCSCDIDLTQWLALVEAAAGREPAEHQP